MSMKLADAMSKGKVVVRNKTNCEVSVVIPNDVPGKKPLIDIIGPGREKDLTKKYAIAQIKKSPNLIVISTDVMI